MKRIDRAKEIKGWIVTPPDKSMTHRMIFFASMAEGESTVENPLIADDTLKTIDLVERVGINVSSGKNWLKISRGKILEPIEPIFCGNSGTTTRMGLGFLSTLPIFVTLYGDGSLSKRPMDRVIQPLKLLGAQIDGRENASKLPVSIKGGKLGHAEYISPVSSAQVKSAFIIAALSGDDISRYEEPVLSRDHTESFLKQFDLIENDGRILKIKPSVIPHFKSKVIGDFSSAAFFMALGVCHPYAKLTVKGIGLNKTRTGFLNVLKRMGAKIEVTNFVDDFEPYGDVTVESSKLTGVEIFPEEIPSLIDEIPLVALLGAFASGKTIVRGASEVRKKESDRISSTLTVLSKMGTVFEEYEDGFSIEGGHELKECSVNSFGDHRIAMMATIAGLCSNGVVIEDPEVVSISYPGFYSDLEKLVVR
jgi:3-phosphoshikimate 1-carboxyvinyltransferase